MKRMNLRALLLICAGALSMMGCTKNGTLVIENDTNGLLFLEIGGVAATVESGDSESRSWKMTASILKTETRNVEVSGLGVYVFSFSDDYKVTAGETERVDIDADGGAILVVNNHPTVTILSVYLSPSSDGTWGSDDLSGDIGPGESHIWTVAPGSWDIRLEDNLYYYELYYRTVSLDQTYTVTFSQSSEGVRVSSETKDRVPDPVKTADRVQELPPPIYR